MLARTNAEWVRLLRLPPPQRDAPTGELRALLLRGLRATFAGRGGVDRSTLEDLTQDAVIRVIDALDTFRGESLFLTWAMKVAVRVALTELRHRRWRDVSLDALRDEGFQLPDATGFGNPEKEAVRRAVMAALMNAVKNDLTDRQRTAMMAIRFRGMPLAEVARMLDTNRNALYKLMHDARRRLKSALLASDLDEHEIAEALA